MLVPLETYEKEFLGTTQERIGPQSTEYPGN